MATPGWKQEDESDNSGVNCVTITCQHCGNLSMVLGEVSEDKVGNGVLVSYSLVCDKCGAKSNIVESWDLSGAQEELKSEYKIVGLI